MLERDFKKWLNSTYDGTLTFIEPAHGSSIGVPDVDMPVDEKTLPIELKIGHKKKMGGIGVSIRPSQMRYHILSNERGQKTIILVAVGTKSKFDVYLFDGACCEAEQYKKMWSWVLVLTGQSCSKAGDRHKLDSAFKRVIGGLL